MFNNVEAESVSAYSDDGYYNLSDDSESSDESSDEDESVINLEDENEMIFDGAKITVFESMMSLFAFSIAFKATGVMLAFIIDLILLHVPTKNKCVKSLYMFKKIFNAIKSPIVVHCYCLKCKVEVSEQVCGVCQQKKDMNYFIEMPLLSQLSLLLRRNGFYQKLQHRFTRTKSNVNNLEDIFDGEVYKSYFDDNGFLSNPSNLSFTWNSDGIPIFKSSNFSIWPFYLVINELPYEDRFKPENTLFVGLWFGKFKPIPDLFLNSFVESMNKLFEGVKMRLYDKSFITLKAIIICGTCDLPAKAIFLNLKQHNGNYGCPRCTQKGVHVDGVHVYHYENRLKLRSTEECLKAATLPNDQAHQEARKGVKGPSVLSKLMDCFVENTGADIMHCAFLNLSKRLFSVWFDAKNHYHPGSLRSRIEEINKRIKELRVLDFLPRMPRSIEDFHYWKASEMKWFILCFSIPILHDFMDAEFFRHHVLLVNALTILNSSSISLADLEKARVCLRKYVEKFQVLYGELHMTCNLHQLLHMVESVEKFGPLWVTSCFSFENLNGILKSMVHSSKKPELQICGSANMMFKFFHLKDNLTECNTEVLAFCNKAINRTRERKLVKKIRDGIRMVGKSSNKKSLSDFPDEIKEIIAPKIEASTDLYSFKRAIVKKTLFETESYCAKKRGFNACVQFRRENAESFGVIQDFIIICKCINGEHEYCTILAIVKEFIAEKAIKCSLTRSKLDTTYIGVQTGDIIAVELDNFESVCFKIDIETFNFLVKPVNRVELE